MVASLTYLREADGVHGADFGFPSERFFRLRLDLDYALCLVNIL